MHANLNKEHMVTVAAELFVNLLPFKNSFTKG